MQVTLTLTLHFDDAQVQELLEQGYTKEQLMDDYQANSRLRDDNCLLRAWDYDQDNIKEIVKK